LRRCTARWGLVAPEASVVWSSEIPFERNDGGVWAGRGGTFQVSGGLRADCGPVRVMFVPEIWHARNRPFPVLGPNQSWQSGWASPFYSGREASADLPLRFGSKPLTVFELGQSAIEVDAGPVTLGAGTQSQWWGPGVRNALLVSTHAAGIPSLYVRTRAPIRTRLGDIEGRWIAGALTESQFYDFEPKNDLRSLSAAALTLATAVDTNLTVGIARLVYRSVENGSQIPGRFFEAVTSWEEQMLALFGRWVFPRNGLETYVEWARTRLPSSLRSFLVSPAYSQGYTMGLQWLSNTDSTATAWRTQLEATFVEQPRTSRGVEPPSFYVSAVVPQGYTQRGQIVGAAVGPGGSGQFLGVDRMRPTWYAGVVFGRVRWNNEQYYRRPTGNLHLVHDVSLFSGLRGAYRVQRFDLSGELISEKRINYLFQSNIQGGFGEDHTFDIRNTSVRIALTPR
jgi:capsule assembly protein Wzi